MTRVGRCQVAIGLGWGAPSEQDSAAPLVLEAQLPRNLQWAQKRGSSAPPPVRGHSAVQAQDRGKEGRARGVARLGSGWQQRAKVG